MIPSWFQNLSVLMLVIGGACALWILVDILLGHRQQMWIMNIVWPVVALFGTLAAVAGYYRYGRLATHHRVAEAKKQGREPPNKEFTPFPMMVVKGAAHCGSGCAIGDILAEFLALGFPTVAVWLGWKSLFPATPDGKVFAVWILDFIFAFVLGVAFQFFTIKPMRDLSVKEGLVQALKADTLSLTAWQLGMYGFMAVAHFWLFARIWETQLKPSMPEFWFCMQIAMICGFATSYPVNWFLLKAGIKEKM